MLLSILSSPGSCTSMSPGNPNRDDVPFGDCRMKPWSGPSRASISLTPIPHPSPTRPRPLPHSHHQARDDPGHHGETRGGDLVRAEDAAAGGRAAAAARAAVAAAAATGAAERRAAAVKGEVPAAAAGRGRWRFLKGRPQQLRRRAPRTCCCRACAFDPQCLAFF